MKIVHTQRSSQPLLSLKRNPVHSAERPDRECDDCEDQHEGEENLDKATVAGGGRGGGRGGGTGREGRAVDNRQVTAHPGRLNGTFTYNGFEFILDLVWWRLIEFAIKFRLGVLEILTILLWA